MAIITSKPSVVEQTFMPVQLPVISRTTSTPPVAPTKGDRYIIPVGATGIWTPYPGYIAEYVPNLDCLVYTPKPYSVIYVVDEGIYVQAILPTGTFLDFPPIPRTYQETITDDDTTEIPLGSSTIYRAAIITYSLVGASKYTSGKIMVVTDDADVAVDDERLIFENSKCLNEITFTGDIDSGNIRLIATASGVGGNAELKYTLELFVKES